MVTPPCGAIVRGWGCGFVSTSIAITQSWVSLRSSDECGGGHMWCWEVAAIGQRGLGLGNKREHAYSGGWEHGWDWDDNELVWNKGRRNSEYVMHFFSPSLHPSIESHHSSIQAYNLDNPFLQPNTRLKPFQPIKLQCSQPIQLIPNQTRQHKIALRVSSPPIHFMACMARSREKVS